jgi:hypothetical protein
MFQLAVRYAIHSDPPRFCQAARKNTQRISLNFRIGNILLPLLFRFWFDCLRFDTMLQNVQ